MPKLKQIQIEDVEEDTEQNLRITKRKKRYPGGKIFAPGLVSNDLFNFVCDEYLKQLEELEENNFEGGWEEFVEGLV